MKNIYNEEYTLGQIVRDHSFILMDTCVLSQSIGSYKNIDTLSGKALVIEEENQFRLDLMHYLEMDSPIFITPLVYDEYAVRVNSNYIEPIETLDSRDQVARRKLLENKIKNGRFEERKLLKLFEKGKIFILEEENQRYDSLSGRYFWFKNEKAIERFKIKEPLSKTDFDLLISAAVLSYSEESLALLTSDYGIIKAWSYLCKDIKIDSNKFELFIRKFPLIFEKKSAFH